MSAAGWRRRRKRSASRSTRAFAATEVLYDDKGAVRGIADRRHGHRQGWLATRSSYTRGMELLGKVHAVRRRLRGSLTKQLIAKYSLDAKSEPPKFGIGLEGGLADRSFKHQKGLIQHSFGWPLNNSTGGGSFLYHYDDNHGRGRLRRASQL